MNKVKISRYNYEEMMPGALSKFSSLISMSYCPYREGHIGNGHFGVNRYLYYDDIIILMERKIDKAKSPVKYGGTNGSLKTKKEIAKWESVIKKAKLMKAQNETKEEE